MSLGVFTPLTEAQHSGGVWILKSFLVCCVQCYLWSEFIKRSMITLKGESTSSWIWGGCFLFPNAIFFPVVRKLSINLLHYILFSVGLVKELSHCCFLVYISSVNWSSLPLIHTIFSLYFKVSISICSFCISRLAHSARCSEYSVSLIVQCCIRVGSNTALGYMVPFV